ncbi:MAG: hypothetical protein KKD31_19065 [Bacteroidetes bacterium]|nr:hypothetical protein [Bacteroidota bacterium]
MSKHIIMITDSMKRIIVLAFIFCNLQPVCSQTDSLLLKNYEQKILENSKLKDDLQSANQRFSELSKAYYMDTLSLQKLIKELQNELDAEKQKVSDLGKAKIKKERDHLQAAVDSLNALMIKQNQEITSKDNQISVEKASAKVAMDSARSEGKAKGLEGIVNSYKNKQFDELVLASTKKSVTRDIKLVGNNPEVGPILNNLLIYFNSLELLSKKFDADHVMNAQTQLTQIKFQSKLIEQVKEGIDFYKDFNIALRETITKLIDLDKKKSAAGNSDIQKLKFNDILTILTDFMYNYYDYPNYPYLSEVVLEIIKRKRADADADVQDLLEKL